MQKILTILIPVYNTEKYIKRCLDSVLLKDVLEQIEILVVSDGSGDSSVSIIKEYQQKYKRTLRLIEKDNGGHGSTINVGIKEAKGKYFKVLDSDDWFNCNDFKKFVERLSQEDADLVVTNYRQEHVYNEKSILNEYNGLEEGKLYNFDSVDLKKLKGEYFVMATSTYKLEVLKKSNLHLLEKTFYVDMQYNIEPIINVKNFIYYNLDIYRYYIGRPEQSVNVASFVKNQDSHKRVVKYLIAYYNKHQEEYSKVKKEYIETILIYMLNTHYTIYCEYETNYCNAYQEIKEFDKYLKNESQFLYEKLNAFGYIRYYRKNKFIFIRYFNKLYKKIYTLFVKIKRKLGV